MNLWVPEAALRVPKSGIPKFLPPPPPGIAREERFALPYLPTLLSGEIDEARDRRLRSVRREAKKFYDAVVRHLGENNAGALFQRFASPAVRKRGKRSDAKTNALVLQAYDQKAISGMSISEAARTLYSEHGSKFGASDKAIEKRIRRLTALRETQLKKQAERQAARSKALTDAYTQQFGNEPTSFLSEASSKLDRVPPPRCDI